MGTNSWKFRGWEGSLYSSGYGSEAEFQRECLKDYAQYLPTVGVDFTYYEWPRSNQIVSLVNSVPADFRFCFKVTDKIVTPRFPDIARYGRMGGKENPFFLNPEVFLESYWKILEGLGPQIGLVLFEFPHLEPAHLDRLRDFFQALPKQIPCALELRSRGLCSAEFYRRLDSWNVATIYNSWTDMPNLAEQWRITQANPQSKLPLCVRAMLRPGRSYEEASRNFEPYSILHEEYGEFTNTVALMLEQAAQAGREAYVLVGNLLEGSAPFSLGRIAERLEKTDLGTGAPLSL